MKSNACQHELTKKEKKAVREEKLQLIQQKLEEGVKEIFHSDKYAEYLKAMSRFRSYSINNVILIISQCPEASLVAGFKTWQKEFNRTVNQGEKGLMIYAPQKVKVPVEETPDAEELQNSIKVITGKDGKLYREFMSYKPAYVFDVSQTSGDEIPDVCHRLTASVADYDSLLSVLEAVSTIPVRFEEDLGGANGCYSRDGIRVLSGLSEAQTIKTLVHEIAHAMLGHDSLEVREKWDRETREVQAESVAFFVTQMLGVDSSDYSFGYIAGWSKDREVSELQEHLSLIKSTADTIMDMIEKESIAVVA